MRRCGGRPLRLGQRLRLAVSAEDRSCAQQGAVEDADRLRLLRPRLRRRLALDRGHEHEHDQPRLGDDRQNAPRRSRWARQPYDATFAYGAAWATANGAGDVERIDPARNRVVKKWPLPTAVGVVGAFGSIWAAGADGVIRIDPATNTVVARVAVEGAGWTAASGDAVWVTTAKGVTRIDPQTNAVAATISLPVALGDPAVVAGKVWVPKIRQNQIAIIDPATNTVERTPQGRRRPFVVTEIRGEAWIPSWKGRDIWRVRP